MNDSHKDGNSLPMNPEKVKHGKTGIRLLLPCSRFFRLGLKRAHEGRENETMDG